MPTNSQSPGYYGTTVGETFLIALKESERVSEAISGKKFEFESNGQGFIMQTQTGIIHHALRKHTWYVFSSKFRVISGGKNKE
jgi:hypothetical protein